MRKEIASLNSPFPYFLAAALISTLLAGCSSDNMRIRQPLLGHDGNGYQRMSSNERPAQANAWEVANNYNYKNNQYANAQPYQSQPQQPAYNSYGNNYNAYMGNEVTGSINAQPLAPVGQGYPSTQGYQQAQPVVQSYNSAAPIVKPVSRPQVSSWNVGPQAVEQQPVQNSGMATAGAVQVQQGDTLMSIARRYNVQPADLLRVNNLVNASQVMPGQMLTLPTQSWNNITEQPKGAVQGISNQIQNNQNLNTQQNMNSGPQGYRPPNVQYQPWKRTSLDKKQLVQLAQNMAVMNDAAPVGFIGSMPPKPTYRPKIAESSQAPVQMAQGPASFAVHEAVSGETYATLARQYGLSASVISHANGATPSTPIEAGQKIVVPGLNNQQLQMLRANNSVQQTASVRRPANDNELTTGSVPQSQPQPVQVQKQKNIASIPVPTQKPVAVASVAKPAVSTKVSDPATTGSIPPSQATEKVASSVRDEATASNLKFRWPVKGRVVSAFGSKTEAGQNDGVNIAVPEGTSVKAAEDGVVAYTGNELKGYGNLVLISHNDGSVTAYAHNSEILVKKGEKVTRGQTISKAGQTGSVNQPQVHFEIRKGSKPVDPMQFLSNG